MSEHKQPNKLVVLRGITVHFENAPDASLDISKVAIIDRMTNKPLFDAPNDATDKQYAESDYPTNPGNLETQVHKLDQETTDTLQTMLRARGVIDDNVKIAPELYRNGDWTGLKADVGPGFGALEAEAPVSNETLKNIQEGIDNATK